MYIASRNCWNKITLSYRADEGNSTSIMLPQNQLLCLADIRATRDLFFLFLVFHFWFVGCLGLFFGQSWQQPRQDFFFSQKYRVVYTKRKGTESIIRSKRTCSFTGSNNGIFHMMALSVALEKASLMIVEGAIKSLFIFFGCVRPLIGLLVLAIWSCRAARFSTNFFPFFAKRKYQSRKMKRFIS